ncbi:unnamed protein product [Heligmosomoides polygyrus]|uniref:TFIIS central domain-containing protein n=1 Tax=Heligmosomoides polygyrus TaxID=6339 RepID=A0A183FWZ8_HELPZ|nr:unnamed protein product [Heligmosomoides polygyrus]
MADGDTMQDELELEFRQLCGGESERHDILQVCDRLERSIKVTRTSIMAEVSKRWRTGNLDHETIEVAGQQCMEQSLEHVATDPRGRVQKGVRTGKVDGSDFVKPIVRKRVGTDFHLGRKDP